MGGRADAARLITGQGLIRGAYFRGLLTGPITGGFLQGRGLLQDLSKILITGAYCRAGSYLDKFPV